MSIYDESSIKAARDLHDRLASQSLTPEFAKLYSQYTRLRAERSGLAGWNDADTERCLDDAVRLIDAGFIERDTGGQDWQSCLRRAGELLEWLAHPKLNTRNLPLRLLSAATYQLAGYPARASGLLIDESQDENESNILQAVLQTDFPTFFKSLNDYWATKFTKGPDQDRYGESQDSISQWLIDETISAFGVLGAEMRWGSEPRFAVAVEKLRAISKAFLHGVDAYSWLLARLSAEVAAEYYTTALRQQAARILETVSPEGQKALERYVRSWTLAIKLSSKVSVRSG